MNGKKDRSKGMSVITKGLSVLLTAVVAFSAGYGLGDMNNNQPEVSTEAVEQPVGENEAVVNTNEAVEKIMAEMTLSEMVYQMMFVTPEAVTGVGTVVAAGETTKNAIAKYPVGGIVYFAKNFESREQTAAMIQNTQSYSKIPLFISVDEEGGRVARLGRNQNMGTTLLPAMKTIGDTKDSTKAYDAGVTLANDLKALGFNMDFAPVADIIINEKNSEIGDRSFGTDADNVASMVGEITRGMEENGLSATLKHFPGHGSTYANSHTGYSESTRTLDELRGTEFKAFKAGIDAGADFIMISHMTLVNATEEKVPSSISKEVITDLLIGELGYKGIVITDSFQMGAITDSYTPGEAAVKAVMAGVDMILMTPKIEEAHDAIVQAVEDGTIPKERIEESVRKILTVKCEKGMLN